MKQRRRVLYRVMQRPDGRWLVARDGVTFSHSGLKAHAVMIGRALAQPSHARGKLTQLVVHGRDGRIQYEHTYGEDPKRRVG